MYLYFICICSVLLMQYFIPFSSHGYQLRLSLRKHNRIGENVVNHITSYFFHLKHWDLNKIASSLQMAFLNAFSVKKSLERIFIEISLKFVPEGLIDSKLALVQVVPWHWIHIDISLSKPILTRIYYAIWCHKASNALHAEMVFISTLSLLSEFEKR